MAANGPGWRSAQGLAWLARVGVAPHEPWRAAMGWATFTAMSHARPLGGGEADGPDSTGPR
jgi:hypothetical protein